MTALKPIACAAVAALSLAAAPALHAEDCREVSKYSEPGSKRTLICAAESSREEFDLPFITDRLQLELPNLALSAIDYTANGYDPLHRITIEVTNTASVSAPPAELQVLVQSPEGTGFEKFTVQSLAPGGVARIALGPVYVPYVNNVVSTIEVVAIVDPFDPKLPMGQVWETDENDNVLTRRIVVDLGI